MPLDAMAIPIEENEAKLLSPAEGYPLYTPDPAKVAYSYESQVAAPDTRLEEVEQASQELMYPPTEYVLTGHAVHVSETISRYRPAAQYAGVGA